MSNLTVFNFVTLDGYFKGAKGDISWHTHGIEENKYAGEMLKSNNTLLFGRLTYELMASYWTTPFALENDSVVAKAMNSADKIVFSRTLKKPKWENTKLIKNNIAQEIQKRKQEKGSDMTILGSGSIVTLCAEHGLIDEYQIMVDPVIIGKGTPMFKGLKHKQNLKLVKTKTFKTGVVLLCYQPSEKK